MNINVSEIGEVLSFGHSFHLESFQEIPSANIDVVQAFKYFCQHLISLQLEVNINRSSVEEYLAGCLFLAEGEESFRITSKFAKSPSHGEKCFLRTPNNGIESCWNFEVELEDNWLNVFISSQSGELLGYTDWVSEFSHGKKGCPNQSSYLVFPLGTNDPLDGPAEIRHGPASARASPKGWHLLPMNQTTGNNVIAQENHDLYSDWEYNYRPHGGALLELLYMYDDTKDPRLSVNASITNLFYWNNLLHDLYYEYGFDEKAGNFQMDNFNRGGSGGDPVIAHAQDGSGVI